MALEAKAIARVGSSLVGVEESQDGGGYTGLLFCGARFLADDETMDGSLAALMAYGSSRETGLCIEMSRDVGRKHRRSLEQLLSDFTTAKVRVVKFEGDEKVDHSGMDTSVEASKIALQTYIEALRELPAYARQAVEKSGVVGRVNLDSSMWGSEVPSGVVSKFNENLEFLNGTVSMLERLSFQSAKAARSLLYTLEIRNKIDAELLAIRVPLLVDKVCQDYELVKGMVLDIVSALYPVYSIDRIFRKYMENPASWFIPSGVLGDFNESFEGLLVFVGKTPQLDPLLDGNLKAVSNRITQ